MKPDLKAMRQREQAATQGEWLADEKGVGGIGQFSPWFGIGPMGDAYGRGFDVAVVEKKPDAEFIAHARTDVPALLDYCESLETKLAEVTSRRDAAVAQARRVKEAFDTVQTEARAKALEEAASLLDRVPGYVVGLQGGKLLTEMAAEIRTLASPLERAFGAWAGDASPASTDAGKGRDNE